MVLLVSSHSMIPKSPMLSDKSGTQAHGSSTQQNSLGGVDSAQAGLSAPTVAEHSSRGGGAPECALSRQIVHSFTIIAALDRQRYWTFAKATGSRPWQKS
jgi:hypothetical protein